MDALFRVSGSVKRDPGIDRWLNQQPIDLGDIASEWFAQMRECGEDVRELIVGLASSRTFRYRTPSAGEVIQ